MNWVTKEGFSIEISKMTTSHLLATIHMIERNRMNNLTSLSHVDNATQAIVDYYSQFPEEYHALCDEAERRHVIQRGGNKPGLVRRKK